MLETALNTPPTLSFNPRRKGSEKTKKKKIGIVIGSLLSLILLLLGGWALYANTQSQDIRNQAATGQPMIAFDAATKSVVVQQSVSTQIVLSAGPKQLTAVALGIKYDPAAVEITSVTNLGAFPVELVTHNIDTSRGYIKYVLGVSPTSPFLTGDTPIVGLNIKSLKAGSTTISFDQAFTAATALNESAANVLTSYGQIAITGTAPADTIPPTVGLLTVSQSSTDSATRLSTRWTAANDNVTPVAQLHYSLCQKPTVAEIDSVAECEAAKIIDFTPNLLSREITGLTPNTEYAFNVLVRDAAGNKAVYGATAKKTAQAPVTQICQWCSGTCKLESPNTPNCTTEAVDGKICQLVGTACAPVDASASGRPKVSITFKLQGLQKANIAIPMEIKTKATVGSAPVEHTYQAQGRSNTEKFVQVEQVLSQLPVGFTGTVEIRVKPTVALRKNVGTITVVAGTSQYTIRSIEDQVIVGDFVRGVDAQNRDQTNILSVVDLGRIVNLFRDANDIYVPAEGDTKELDVDYNGIVDIQDLVFAKNNLDKLYIPGE